MSNSETCRWKDPDRERGRDHESAGCKAQAGTGCNIDPGLYRADLSGTGAGEKNCKGTVTVPLRIIVRGARLVAGLLLDL